MLPYFLFEKSGNLKKENFFVDKNIFLLKILEALSQKRSYYTVRQNSNTVAFIKIGVIFNPFTTFICGIFVCGYISILTFDSCKGYSN